MNSVWRQILFSLAFAVAIPTPVYFVFYQHDGGAWILVLAGAVGMLLTRLEDVTSFTLGPLKARLETQIGRAKAAVDTANATTEQLRNFGAALAVPILSRFLTSRDYSGPRREQYEVKEAIVQQLRDLGVSEPEVREVTSNWRRWAEVDHQARILEAMGKTMSADEISAHKHLRISSEVAKLQRRTFQGEDVSPAELAAIAANFGIAGKEVDETILDLAHFKKTDALRRPEILQHS